MLDTMTSRKIKPFLVLFFGSSSTDSEGADFFNSPYPLLRHIPFREMSAVPDIASHAGRITMSFKNETFRYQETISEEMLEHDVVVKMPSLKRFSIMGRIARIRKATPKIVVSEKTSFED